MIKPAPSAPAPTAPTAVPAPPATTADLHRLRNLLPPHDPPHSTPPPPSPPRSLLSHREELRHLHAALAVPHHPGLISLRADHARLSSALNLARLESAVAAADARLQAAAAARARAAELHADRARAQLALAAREKDGHVRRLAAANKTLTRALEVERSSAGIKVKAAATAREHALERSAAAARGEADLRVQRAERRARVANEALADARKAVDKARKDAAENAKSLKKANKAAVDSGKALDRAEDAGKELEKERNKLAKEVKRLQAKLDKGQVAVESATKAKEVEMNKLQNRLDKGHAAIEAAANARDALRNKMNDALKRAREDAKQAAKAAESEWEPKLDERTRQVEQQALEIKQLQTKLSKLEEIHDREYTLPPASSPGEDFSVLLSPAPLAAARRGTAKWRNTPTTPVRRSVAATPTLRGQNLTPVRRGRVDDAASESRSRFTDSLPFAINEDEHLATDAGGNGREGEAEEEAVEVQAAIEKRNRGRHKKNTPSRKRARVTASKPPVKSTSARKSSDSLPAEEEDAGAEGDDILPDDTGASQAPAKTQLPATKRRKVSRVKKTTRPSPPVVTIADQAPIVERRAGGRVLRSRRTISYDYDKNDRDIVGKAPGYEVDRSALRRKPVARSHVVAALDFNEAAQTSRAVAAAEEIRRTVQQRRSRQVVRKTVGS